MSVVRIGKKAFVYRQFSEAWNKAAKSVVMNRLNIFFSCTTFNIIMRLVLEIGRRYLKF